MIDNFSILLSHALILIAFIFMLKRDDLDVEEPPIPDTEPDGFSTRPALKKDSEKTTEAWGKKNSAVSPRNPYKASVSENRRA